MPAPGVREKCAASLQTLASAARLPPPFAGALAETDSDCGTSLLIILAQPDSGGRASPPVWHGLVHDGRRPSSIGPNLTTTAPGHRPAIRPRSAGRSVPG